MREATRLPKICSAKPPAKLSSFDTNNYFPQQRDSRIAALENRMVESRWVERHLGRPVVKAFNNIQATDLAKRGLPAHSAGRVALPVAGDNQNMKSVVLQIVDQLGFDGVDAGGLDASWRQQPGTPVFCTNLDASGVRRALSEASANGRRNFVLLKKVRVPGQRLPDAFAGPLTRSRGSKGHEMVTSRAYRPVHPCRRRVERGFAISGFHGRSSPHRNIAALQAKAFTACTRPSIHRLNVMDGRQRRGSAITACNEAACPARVCIA